MPIVLSQFTADEIDTRYKEDFLTASMNTRVGGGILPVGIHSGFYLSTSGVNLNITVTNGPDDESLAIVPSGQYAVTIRRTGALAVDLTAQASTTVAICLYASYTQGGTTSAEIRAYELSPSDEFTSAPENADLVVLGQVVVPASGSIVLGSITPWRRRPARGSVLPGQRHQLSLIRNPAFGFSAPGGNFALSAPPWEHTTTTTAISFQTSDVVTPPYPGSTTYQTVNVTTGATPTTLELFQYVSVPFVHADVTNVGEQYISIEAVIDVNEVPSGGTAEIFVQFFDESTVFPDAEETIAVDLSSVTTVTISDSVKPPAGANWVGKVGIRFSGVSWVTTGEKVDVYYLQAQLVNSEYSGLTDPNQTDSQFLKSNMGANLILFDPGSLGGAGFDPVAAASPLAAVVRFDTDGASSGDGLLKLLRVDETDSDNTGVGVSLSLRGIIQNLHESFVANGQRDIPAIQTVFDNAADMTLFWEANPDNGAGVSEPSVRIYSNRDGEIWLTSNAYYDEGTALWNKDFTGESAAIVVTAGFGQGIKHLWELSTLVSTTWTHANWTGLSVTKVLDVSAFQSIGGTGATGASITWTNGITVSLGIQSVLNSSSTLLDLRPHLPDDAVITAVRVVWTPGDTTTNRGTGTINALNLQLLELTHDFSTPAIRSLSSISTVEQSDTSSIETRSLSTGLPHTYDPAKTLMLSLTSGNNGGNTTNYDSVHSVEITYTTQGVQF